MAGFITCDEELSVLLPMQHRHNVFGMRFGGNDDLSIHSFLSVRSQAIRLYPELLFCKGKTLVGSLYPDILNHARMSACVDEGGCRINVELFQILANNCVGSTRFAGPAPALLFCEPADGGNEFYGIRMVRFHFCKLIVVTELAGVAGALDDVELVAGLTSMKVVAQDTDEGNNAGDGRDHEMALELGRTHKYSFGSRPNGDVSSIWRFHSSGVNSPSNTNSTKSSSNSSWGAETSEYALSIR